MSDERPNIVVILTDDQGFWAMGCAGNDEIKTPNLDRLAGTGVRFQNFFCTSPVCSPARASILTGQIPSRHGVHDWLCAGNTIEKYEPECGDRLIEFLEGQSGYTDFLANNGYTCGMSGKWHLGDSHHPQKSFGFWKVHARGGGHYYGAPMVDGGRLYEEPRYVTDVITDNALDFLRERKDADCPFYLSLHYTAPHSPWSRENHPNEVYDEYYENCPFRSVPEVQRHPWQGNALFPRTAEERRSHLSGYYAAVTEMDRNVGRVLDWLEENGMRENTLVFFLSDNGMSMGHHGIYGKGNGTFPLNMYDTAVKIPAIASWPAAVSEGQVRDELLSQYDIMPTILEAAGIEAPESETAPGRSFYDLLVGDETGGEREAVVVYDEYGPVRMIRTREWKYIHRYPYGPHELYNLCDDPGEVYNLVEEGGCKEQIARLRGQMEEWFDRYADPAIDGRHEGVTGGGQSGWAGLSSHGQQNYRIRSPEIMRVLPDSCRRIEG